MSEQQIGPAIPQSQDSPSGWVRAQVARGKRDIEYIVREGRTLSLVLRHPQAPWRAKLVAGCAVGYLVSPIQLIPTFIPIIGQLDDLFVLFVGMKLLRKLTPAHVLALCEARATSPISVRSIEDDGAILSAQQSDLPA